MVDVQFKLQKSSISERYKIETLIHKYPDINSPILNELTKYTSYRKIEHNNDGIWLSIFIGFLEALIRESTDHSNMLSDLASNIIGVGILKYIYFKELLSEDKVQSMYNYLSELATMIRQAKQTKTIIMEAISVLQKKQNIKNLIVEFMKAAHHNYTQSQEIIKREDESKVMGRFKTMCQMSFVFLSQIVENMKYNNGLKSPIVIFTPKAGTYYLLYSEELELQDNIPGVEKVVPKKIEKKGFMVQPARSMPQQEQHSDLFEYYQSTIKYLKGIVRILVKNYDFELIRKSISQNPNDTERIQLMLSELQELQNYQDQMHLSDFINDMNDDEFNSSDIVKLLKEFEEKRSKTAEVLISNLNFEENKEPKIEQRKPVQDNNMDNFAFEDQKQCLNCGEFVSLGMMMHLGCEDYFCKSCLQRRCFVARDAMKFRDLQICCPSSFCNYILTEDEIRNSLEEKYQDFYSNLDLKNDFSNQCMICTTTTCLTLINIHDQHSVCPDCFRKYANCYNVFKIDKIKYHANNPDHFEKIKCPARQCQFQFGMEIVRQAYTTPEFAFAISNVYRKYGLQMPEAQPIAQNLEIGNHNVQRRCCLCDKSTSLLKKFSYCQNSCKFAICGQHAAEFSLSMLVLDDPVCPECEGPFQREVLEKMSAGEFVLENDAYFYEEMSEEEKKILEEIQNKFNAVTFECEICYESLDSSQIISLFNCPHRFCKDCLKKQIETLYGDGKGLHNITCPIPNCSESIPYETILDVVGKEMTEKLSIRTIEAQMKLFACPKCGARFEIPPNNQNKNIECINGKCKAIICRLCNDEKHEGPCKNRVKLIESFKKKNIMVVPCPYCLQLSEKLDDACNHVKCFFCQKDFCIVCGCKRSPVLSHGNHYHRPSCSDYRPCPEADKESEKCEECRLLKKLCPKPKDLENGDIPEDEKPLVLLNNN